MLVEMKTLLLPLGSTISSSPALQHCQPRLRHCRESLCKI